MTTTTKIDLSQILKNKLNTSNYIDWIRQIKIVLRGQQIQYVLEEEPLPEPAENANARDRNAYNKYLLDNNVACSIMLGAMEDDLQKQHEHMDAYTMAEHLRGMFEKQARTERYDLSKALYRSKMAENSSPVDYALKMNGYIERLASLGFVLDHDLTIDFILQSLPDSYAQFVLDYQMNKVSTTIPELINLLKHAYEANQKSSKAVMVVTGSSTSKKKKNKKKGKKSLKAKGGVSKTKKSEAKDDRVCFNCGKNGHWRRNCKEYIASVQKAKASKGIFTIEINVALSKHSWVLNTGCASLL